MEGWRRREKKRRQGEKETEGMSREQGWVIKIKEGSITCFDLYFSNL